jgi:hypothetical protein
MAVTHVHYSQASSERMRDKSCQAVSAHWAMPLIQQENKLCDEPSSRAVWKPL